MRLILPRNISWHGTCQTRPPRAPGVLLIRNICQQLRSSPLWLSSSPFYLPKSLLPPPLLLAVLSVYLRTQITSARSGNLPREKKVIKSRSPVRPDLGWFPPHWGPEAHPNLVALSVHVVMAADIARLGLFSRKWMLQPARGRADWLIRDIKAL